VKRQDFQKFIGRSFDGLKLSDRWALSGHWVATELYSPQRLPLRIMAAIGMDARECIDQIVSRGLDPGRFEYEPMQQPYQP
jgi:hypothetical protein